MTGGVLPRKWKPTDVRTEAVASEPSRGPFAYLDELCRCWRDDLPHRHTVGQHRSYA